MTQHSTTNTWYKQVLRMYMVLKIENMADCNIRCAEFQGKRTPLLLY